MDIMIQEGNCACLCVHLKPKGLLHSGTVSLPLYQFLCTRQFLCLVIQEMEEPLDRSGGTFKDLTLASWTSFRFRYDIIHIEIYTGEAIQGMRRARKFLWGVDYGAVTRNHDQRVDDRIVHTLQCLREGK